MAEDGSKPRDSGNDFLPKLREALDQPAALDTHGNLFTLDSQDDQLLPRLPNEIVLEEIAPKLSWKVFYTLSLVSRSWRQAIRNHEIYNVRVRSDSTETLLVCNHASRADESHVTSNVLSLYSVRDKSWLQLPPLPQPQRGLPDYSKFVSLGRKIYVLAGDTGRYNSGDSLSDADYRMVYVLDLTGQRDWKRCANLLKPSPFFLCGAINGKIYVFGPTDNGIENIQVYDPKENAWSMVLAPFMEMYFNNHTCNNVVTFGEELFLDIGSIDEDISWDAEIYHPRENKWRNDTNVQFFHEGGLFTAHGKLHRLTSSDIDIYHVDEKVWTRLHSIGSRLPYGGQRIIGPDIRAEIGAIVVTVNDELFVLAHCGFIGYCLFQGKGFGKEGKDIMWEKLTCPLEYEKGSGSVQPFMCTIQI